jgi:hypothetical protein
MPEPDKKQITPIQSNIYPYATKQLNNNSLTNNLSTTFNNELGLNKSSENRLLRFNSFLKLYNQLYFSYKKHKHPSIKKEQLIKAQEAIAVSGILDYEEKDQKKMIDDYLFTVNGDHNINHFISGDIISIRISRFLDGDLFREHKLYTQIDHLRRTGKFNEEYLHFLDVFDKLEKNVNRCLHYEIFIYQNKYLKTIFNIILNNLFLIYF